jgi:cytosine/adenosine deaminase-related metal-dependent hydrolase
MVHYNRAMGPMPLPDEAALVARAATDIGVRIGFATGLKDRNPLVLGDHAALLAGLAPAERAAVEARLVRPPLPPAEQVALADAVAERIAGPMVDAQYGPTAPHWCSDALLAAVAEASARTGRRVHMHLLETRYQRGWADREHPEGIVTHLDRLGLLSPRLTLAHCTWARPAELELLAERGVTISVNTSSNLGIRSGLAPVGAMLKAGCRVAMGLDGLAFDEDDDALREIRLMWALNRGWGFEEAVSRERMLRIALAEGVRSVTSREDGGTLAAGAAADVLLLDAAALDPDALWPAVDPLDLLLARGRAPMIREMIVAGRTAVRDGGLTGIDHPALAAELLGQFRAGMVEDGFALALPALEAAIGAQFRGECC